MNYCKKKAVRNRNLILKLLQTASFLLKNSEFFTEKEKFLAQGFAN